jgi:hypothetical protein
MIALAVNREVKRQPHMAEAMWPRSLDIQGCLADGGNLSD